MSDSIVIIPTYNEKENIQKMLDTVFALPKDFHVLIVDDGSPDGTADIVRANMEIYPDRLHLEERKGKNGLGTAYIHGFKWSLARDYEYIYEMDCDFSHDPNDLLRLYDAIRQPNTDVAVGSRYIKGGKVVNWPFDRIFLSYGASLYVRFITWIPVMDTTGGFVCWSRRVLEKMNLDGIRFVGYAFQIEMKYTAYKLGFQLREIPITFKDREAGVSKMSGKIIKEAVFGVLQMRFRKYTS